MISSSDFPEFTSNKKFTMKAFSVREEWYMNPITYKPICELRFEIYNTRYTRTIELCKALGMEEENAVICLLKHGEYLPLNIKN